MSATTAGGAPLAEIVVFDSPRNPNCHVFAAWAAPATSEANWPVQGIVRQLLASEQPGSLRERLRPIRGWAETRWLARPEGHSALLVHGWAPARFCAQALHIVTTALDGLATEGPKPEQLISARRLTLGELRGRADSAQAAAQVLLDARAVGLPWQYFRNYVVHLNAVDGAAVEQLMTQTAATRPLVVVVGDAEQHRATLQRHAPVRLVDPAAGFSTLERWPMIQQPSRPPVTAKAP